MLGTSKKAFYIGLGLMLLTLAFGCDQSSNPRSSTVEVPAVCVLKNKDYYELQAYTHILTDSSYAMEDIVQPRLQNRFEAYPGKTFVVKSHQTYWGKVQIENRMPAAEQHLEWVLNLSNTFTRVTLFSLAADGTWVASKNGSFLPDREKSFVPTQSGNWFKLRLPPQKVVTLYFQGISERHAMPPSFKAFVQPIDIFYQKLLEGKTWSALFTGLLVMMLLYNLIKFFIVRDRSYIYYSGYLLTVAVYSAYISDDLEDWTGGFLFTGHPAYFSLFKISIYLGLMCWLAFIRSFLDLERLLPKWDKYFKYVTWLGPPLVLVFVFLAFRFNFSYAIDDRATLFYIALVTISGFIFIHPLYRTKDPKGYFITAGIAVICFGFLLTFISRVSQATFTVAYLKICTIIEILIFSVGLAYRQRKQVEASQQADFALRESRLLQEKEQVEAERLRELDDFKSRFFTNISHEFRTPLTVMLGMSEQLAKDEKDEQRRNFLSLLKRNGENLLRLVNQILDLAKLESNALKINYVKGDVLAYLKYIAESLHSLANAQNVMLRVESKEAEITMDYDPERLLQIIYNLLSNAIKFTPSGGKVVLLVGTREEERGIKGGAGSSIIPPSSSLFLTVTDTGTGIPAENLPNIFDRFFQANNLEKAKAGGTGIGLALTRELVLAMGGEISVESTVGKGSTFLVKLPMTTKGALAETGTNMNGEGWKPSVAKSQMPLPSATPLADSSQPQILLIEDNPDVVEYLAACLNEHCQLDFAYNGRAGIEKALEAIPDLIVSDVMMPEKDGFEVVEALKNDERTSHIPIILLTAKADVQSRLSGLRRGADAYLSKPFHQEELLVTVENLLELRRKLQAKYRNWEIGNLPASSADGEIGETSSDSSLPPPSSLEDVFLQKFRTVVEANLTDTDFEMPQLERALAMSRSQIFRKVKALTGKSPSLFIRSIRLRYGRHLLLTTHLTVSEIAYEVGYSALNNFSDAFMEEFGERPTAVRG